jgi:hypothetical protein
MLHKWGIFADVVGYFRGESIAVGITEIYMRFSTWQLRNVKSTPYLDLDQRRIVRKSLSGDRECSVHVVQACSTPLFESNRL